MVHNGSLLRVPTILRNGDRLIIGEHPMNVIRDDEVIFASETQEMKAIERAPAIPDTPGKGTTAPSALLMEVGEKSLALGRWDEAEWILGKLVDDIDARLAIAPTLPAESVERTLQLAVRLAIAASRPRWIDWIFDVHGRLARMLPSWLIDELHEAVRRLRYPPSPSFRAYTEWMRASLGTLSPTDRFLASRVESLLEVASAPR